MHVSLPIVESRCLPAVLHACNVLRRERKLMYRVVFPFELKLPNTTDDAAGRDALYSLFAVVVHVGSGPHHGASQTPDTCDWRCAVMYTWHMLACFVAHCRASANMRCCSALSVQAHSKEGCVNTGGVCVTTDFHMCTCTQVTT